jgi:tRNA wybutosine-synthesizing protein 1
LKKNNDFFFSEALSAELAKKQYGIVGKHSAVEICLWTKKALQGKGICYKQRFYGIDCLRCAQFSPAAAWCQENCIFCWRPNELMRFAKPNKKQIDSPQSVIAGVIAERKKLLSGFGGRVGTERKLFEQSLIPSHWAISLSGEPTLYPKLIELMALLKVHKETKSVFLVSNALETAFFSRLLKHKKSWPSQLYVSLDAPNKELFEKLNKPHYKNSWQRFLKSLKIISKIKTRKIIRLTIIKGTNDNAEFVPDFVSLIKRMKADFVEVKGYMFLGYSRKRLMQENMPLHSEVLNYARKLNKALDYYFLSQAPDSRIVLLGKNKKKQRLF